MKLGDLVDYEGQRWVVHRERPDGATVVLLNARGQAREVPGGLADCVVVANPTTEWPCLTVRDNPRGMFLVEVTRATTGARLVPYVDWILSDPTRAGGMMFVRPDLGVQSAEVLLLRWRQGKASSVRVPVPFATVGQRVARVEGKKPKQVTGYDRLLVDRFDSDDDEGA